MNTVRNWVRGFLGAFVAWLCGAPLVHGQELLRTHWNLWTTPNRAAPLGSLVDIDGDAFRDIILGDSGIVTGEVRLVSGASGIRLRTLTFGSQPLGEFVVALEDVTGDGASDWMATAAGGRTVIWSGATFGSVWDGPYFDSAASIGDIDGDGIADVLQAVYGGVGNSGSARVLYGGRFTLAYSVFAPGAVHYGYSCISLDDLNGDGIGDFAVGAPGGFS